MRTFVSIAFEVLALVMAIYLLAAQQGNGWSQSFEAGVRDHVWP